MSLDAKGDADCQAGRDVTDVAKVDTKWYIPETSRSPDQVDKAEKVQPEVPQSPVEAPTSGIDCKDKCEEEQSEETLPDQKNAEEDAPKYEGQTAQ